MKLPDSKIVDERIDECSQLWELAWSLRLAYLKQRRKDAHQSEAED